MKFDHNLSYKFKFNFNRKMRATQANGQEDHSDKIISEINKNI